MDKILDEYRSKVGNFEIVEIDEDRIAKIRAELDVEAPIDLHWTWNYGHEVEELAALYERGKRGQWNAETDVDWTTPLPLDEWFLPRENLLVLSTVLTMMGADEETCKAAAVDEFAFTISQLLHGEQAALQLCGQLTNACPTMDAKFYAASQVADEARHVEVLAKLLQRKFGQIYPIGATLKVLLDKLLQAPTWKTKTLGMQTLFEGMAVGIFDMIQKASSNPLVSDVIRRVKQDEARHAAFGILTMRKTVKDATEEEMAEMEDFAFNILETLNANQQLDMLNVLGPKYGLDPHAVVQIGLSLPDWAKINSDLYMHTVVPNLARLGLITERTEEKYRACGIMFGDRFGTGVDADVQASMVN
ncbi:MAG: ferritin-like domain-containing protein [Deltaproteobacteria bacterium]|nr:ferritin-like domain-containing protein [Deltaproteobacteria bacterium]